MAQVVDALDSARQAAARGQWRDAYVGFTAAADEELSPADLEAFAEASFWAGHIEEAIGLRERAFAAFDALDDKQSAARIALALWFDHSGRGTNAVSQGWFAKAERLVAGLPDSSEAAHVVLVRGMNRLYVLGEITEAIGDFELAYELADRTGDRNVRAMALVMKGKALVLSGEVDQGLALLDEATAAAVSGELRPFAAGLVYCCTISSCQDVGDLRRAAEWTEAADRWCEGSDVTGFPGACRIHRAEVLKLRGDWPGAERQALAACEELEDFDRRLTGGGFYEIGEIRQRRGDFAAAAEAFAKANELGREPQPGLALLRLAEGRVDAALTAIARALEDVSAPLLRLRHLPAQVEIALAAGETAIAQAAAAELEEIVETFKIGGQRAPAFDATVHFATGQILLAGDEPAAAMRALRRAREEWQKVGAPYETARARTLLGLAYRRGGDEDGATTELEAALATFERLGAKLDEERVKELLGRLQARRTFLFTDIVGSTQMLGTLGDEKWKKLLARHDELLRGQIVAHGGEVIKRTGDGFFAAFEQPKTAVEAAIAIQRALDAEIVAPDVRIGVHTGGAFHTGGDVADYGGQGVHTAARIGAAAKAGEILVSRETIDGQASAFRVADQRNEEFKGFEQPVAVVSVQWR